LERPSRLSSGNPNTDQAMVCDCPRLLLFIRGGFRLGWSLGRRLGWTLGWSLGRRLGWRLGWSLGSGLGWSLGSGLGWTLGWRLGRTLGWTLGWTLGRSLGWSTILGRAFVRTSASVNRCRHRGGCCLRTIVGVATAAESERAEAKHQEENSNCLHRDRPFLQAHVFVIGRLAICPQTKREDPAAVPFIPMRSSVSAVRLDDNVSSGENRRTSSFAASRGR